MFSWSSRSFQAGIAVCQPPEANSVACFGLHADDWLARKRGSCSRYPRRGVLHSQRPSPALTRRRAHFLCKPYALSLHFVGVAEGLRQCRTFFKVQRNLVKCFGGE